MSKAKIEDKNLNKRPVLFTIVVFNKIYFQSFYNIQTLRKFDNNKQTKIFSDQYVKGQIKNEKEQIEKINKERIIDIVISNINIFG